MGAGVTTYAYPATERVLYGAGALAGLAEQCDALGARRVAVLTTPSLRGTALLDQVVTGLGPRVAGVLDRSVQHVPLATVSEALAEVRALAPDALVTVGGGSVIDGAKAVAAALGAGFKDAHDLLAHRIELTPAMTLAFEPLPGTPPPQLAVPTTLSAAEYDGIFGMTHEHTKGLYADPGLAPKVVVLDPAATRHTPERLWAASGIRALDHAVEIFLSRSPTPVTDAVALRAVELLAEHLPRTVVPGGGDDADRLACQQASWLSMLGVDNVTLGLCHGIGHQIGARCGVPHGETSCVMLPTVLAEMVDVTPARMARLALALGEAADGRGEPALAAALPARVRAFVAGLGLPTTLTEVGVTEADVPALAKDAVEDFVVAFAPIDVTEADVVRLLHAAMR